MVELFSLGSSLVISVLPVVTGSLAVDHDIDSALKALEDAGIDPSKL